MVSTRSGSSRQESKAPESLKRRNTEKVAPKKKRKGKRKTQEISHVDSTDDEHQLEEFMAVDLPVAEQVVSQVVEQESSSEGEDEVDWETVALPPRFNEMGSSEQYLPEENTPVYGDVEIVMEAPRPVLKESNWEKAYQRHLREWMHHSHVVLLTAHYKWRNYWCLHPEMMSVCLSIVPDHAKRLLNKDNTETTLKTSIKWLIGWWTEYFKLTGPGLLTVPYHEAVRNDLTLRQWIDQKESDESSDYVENLEAWMNLLSVRSGTRDTSAELFVAILRACGYDARLVCSLQPLPYKIPPASKKIQEDVNTQASYSNEVEENTAKTNKALFPFRPRARAYVSPDKELKSPKAKPPCVWAEVWCEETKRWICVDPIRNYIDRPGFMEPAALNRSNSMSFVLAFSADNRNVTDVTRRYTSNLEKAIRLREPPLTKREKEGGMKLWSDIFLSTLVKKQDKRDMLEMESLDDLETREVMPTSINAFKNHAVYALERHLKKFEVLYPREPVLGSVRGEKVYPRSCVKTVSTADAYRKMGKEIKPGEQPVKMVKANAVTIEKRRLKEQAKQDGHELLVPCYGEWQTQYYSPPPLVNGKLVKNAYGTIDLFTPTMLPQGAAHIPIKGIAKVAKKLKIDYAEAVVDFEFMKMRAVPITDGIVVAEENKSIILEAWDEYEQEEANKAIAKQEKEVYKRWRKLIKSLLIKAHVDKTYGKTKDKKNDKKSEDGVQRKWDAFNYERSASSTTNDGGGGGFLLDEDDN
ncbi:hypothetical protein BD560DRAFT_453258 [Blakeslea trispora]|nr:hypothetical protein BD560DRAFT_453258 [Blakeslea trispora]